MPAPAKKSGCLKWGLIIGGVLLLLAVGVTACSVLVVRNAAETLDENFGSANPADYEVTIDECGTDPSGVPNAAGTFTNRSDTRQGFRLDVEFTEEDGTVASSTFEILSGVAPGRDIAWSTSGFGTTTAQVIECTVTGVAYWGIGN